MNGRRNPIHGMAMPGIGRRTFLHASAGLGLSTFFPDACLIGAPMPTDLGPDRWSLTPSGGIRWMVKKGEAHRDFIEMSGEQVAMLVRYGADLHGMAIVSATLIWPMLRFHPNLTDSHLQIAFGEDASVEEDARFNAGAWPAMTMLTTRRRADGPEWVAIRPVLELAAHQPGLLNLSGGFHADRPISGLTFQRAIFPSPTLPLAFDTLTIHNHTADAIHISIDSTDDTVRTMPERGVYGAYVATRRVDGAGTTLIAPGASIRLATVFEARRADHVPTPYDVAQEETARMARARSISEKLRLDTPDPTFNAAFAFAKWHAAENIFRTKAGLLHSPGGSRYYAAIWANDQAEYANPFFGMLGDPVATEATLNSFRQFARFMNDDYRPIPSSIIAEGDRLWQGAGDRGDMAMIAYGACRFVLANGDRKVADELWPLITWCLEYLGRKVNARGVVESDSDELEGRFPAGRANLCTSSLYHDALLSAEYLGRSLGQSANVRKDYAKRRMAIRHALEDYFGAQPVGFRTYRYYDKADLIDNPKPSVAAYATQPDPLRAWIVVPLTVGILERATGTLDAMFSSALWTQDGLASEAGQTIIWDRATLYGLRGAFAAGATERALPYLTSYTRRRLLGDHVPYPFEAYPEGGKAQLSAESALYCRIFTEGMFGIRPVSLNSFEITPRLPDAWPKMALNSIHAFGGIFDLEVSRVGGWLRIVVNISGKPRTFRLRPGETGLITI